LGRGVGGEEGRSSIWKENASTEEEDVSVGSAVALLECCGEDAAACVRGGGEGEARNERKEAAECNSGGEDREWKRERP
jgi:hypothetical protein